MTPSYTDVHIYFRTYRLSNHYCLSNTLLIDGLFVLSCEKISLPLVGNIKDLFIKF